jgi:drug/metabolite transporter (DMT)-like permease
VIVAHLLTVDERMTPGKLAGVLLGFLGVAVLIGADLIAQVGSQLLAQLACLAATLCYALAGVHARRFQGMGIEPVSVATGQLTAASIIMLPLALLFERPWEAAAAPAGAWAAMLALALLGTSFAYILYFRLLASAGATNSLLVTFLIPISAILLGAMFLGEVLEPRHFAGMALIGAGLAAIDGRIAKMLGRRQPSVAS